MSRKEVVQYLNRLSSGTIAVIIGNSKYSAIDRAINKAILYASEIKSDFPESDLTMDYISNLIHEAQSQNI
jgi:hypothetical protein